MCMYRIYKTYTSYSLRGRLPSGGKPKLEMTTYSNILTDLITFYNILIQGLDATQINLQVAYNFILGYT